MRLMKEKVCIREVVLPKQRKITKKPLKKVGRPKTELDLHELEKLSSLNCTMPEIAHFFDIPLRTLQDK